MASTTVLNHGTFGRLTGVVTAQGPVQFRNVPYSNRPSRWQHSTPRERLPNDFSSDPYDATQWGPMAPQDATSIAFDFGLIQKELPLDRTLRSSEEDCLNLVVTTPSLEAKDLPVMVLCVKFSRDIYKISIILVS
jgi:carboxylesterase type B